MDDRRSAPRVTSGGDRGCNNTARKEELRQKLQQLRREMAEKAEKLIKTKKWALKRRIGRHNQISAAVLRNERKNGKMLLYRMDREEKDFIASRLKMEYKQLKEEHNDLRDELKGARDFLDDTKKRVNYHKQQMKDASFNHNREVGSLDREHTDTLNGIQSQINQLREQNRVLLEEKQRSMQQRANSSLPQNESYSTGSIGSNQAIGEEDVSKAGQHARDNPQNHQPSFDASLSDKDGELFGERARSILQRTNTFGSEYSTTIELDMPIFGKKIFFAKTEVLIGESIKGVHDNLTKISLKPSVDQEKTIKKVTALLENDLGVVMNVQCPGDGEEELELEKALATPVLQQKAIKFKCDMYICNLPATNERPYVYTVVCIPRRSMLFYHIGKDILGKIYRTEEASEKIDESSAFLFIVNSSYHRDIDEYKGDINFFNGDTFDEFIASEDNRMEDTAMDLQKAISVHYPIDYDVTKLLNGPNFKVFKSRFKDTCDVELNDRIVEMTSKRYSNISEALTTFHQFIVSVTEKSEIPKKITTAMITFLKEYSPDYNYDDASDKADTRSSSPPRINDRCQTNVDIPGNFKHQARIKTTLTHNTKTVLGAFGRLHECGDCCTVSSGRKVLLEIYGKNRKEEVVKHLKDLMNALFQLRSNSRSYRDDLRHSLEQHNVLPNDFDEWFQTLPHTY